MFLPAFPSHCDHTGSSTAGEEKACEWHTSSFPASDKLSDEHLSGWAVNLVPRGPGRCLAAAAEQQLQLHWRQRMERHHIQSGGKSQRKPDKSGWLRGCKCRAPPPLGDAAGLGERPLNPSAFLDSSVDSDGELYALKSMNTSGAAQCV